MEAQLAGHESGLQIRGSMPYAVAISYVAALGAVMFGVDIAIISGAVCAAVFPVGRA